MIDSSYYTASMIECNNNFLFQLYFDPSNKSTTSFSRLNSTNSSETFIIWTSWSDNYNSIKDLYLDIDDCQVDIDFAIMKDLLLAKSHQNGHTKDVGIIAKWSCKT